MAIFIGTCGWSYQEWIGVFYPNNNVAKLPFYSKVFETVEVDSSFYKPPSKSMVAGWVRATPPNFKFSLKVPKKISHDKQLKSIERPFLDFLETVEPLVTADKLGCLLLQVPPTFEYTEHQTLKALFNILPPDVNFAVEFGNESWNRQETWELLREHNVANTLTDTPNPFLPIPTLTSKAVAYVRWHGRGSPSWYNYQYSTTEMTLWLERIDKISKSVEIIFGYFNNHYEANAPRNALQFLELAGPLTEAQLKAMRRIRRVDQERKSVIMHERKLNDFFEP